MTGSGSSGKKCVKCGACSAVCPVYQVTGRESVTARGKLHLLNNQPQRLSEIFSQCLLCRACEEVCPRGVKITDIVTATRTQTAGSRDFLLFKQLTARKILSSPLLLQGLGNTRKIFSKLPQESSLFVKIMMDPPNLPSLPQPAGSPEKTQKKERLNYFSGCLASYLAPDIKKATVNLVERFTNYNMLPNKEQTCCGLTSHTSGKNEEARKAARLNIRAFEDNDYPILTSCASCYIHLKNYPKLFSGDSVWEKKAQSFSKRLREFSTFLVDHLPEELNYTGEKVRVAIHDPCHLRFGSEKITAEPRRLIKAIRNIALQEIPGQCCGHGGLFQLNYPAISQKIATKRITYLSKSRPQYLLTTCSGCLLQLNRAIQEADLNLKAYHFSVFINHLSNKIN